MAFISPVVAALAFLLSNGSAQAQQPVISSFSPTVGTAGDVILVSGSGFSVGNIKVYFYPGLAGAVTVRSDIILEVVVPSAAANGPLSIQRDSGPVSSTAANFTRIGTGPFISDVSPAFGSPNDLVSISGVHFAGLVPAGVRFNGVPSNDASVSADGTFISVHVPNGATTGPLAVTSSTGTSNALAPFTILGPGPYVSGFSPNYGSAGTLVLVDGVHFLNATNASFNGVAGSNFTVKSETLIEVRAPAGVTTGPIAVMSPQGTNTSATNFYVQPAITNFVPAAGRPGTNITIYGVNFSNTTQVLVGGLPAVYTVLDNNRIQATVPAAATTDVLRVTTPIYSTFSTNRFKLMPTIYGFTPTAGPVGTSVLVIGANLNGGNTIVRFNGVQAAAPTGLGFGQLTAKVPAGATSGPISVTTDDGSHTNGNTFFLPPAITSFTPTNSPPGTQVLIRGVNFLGASEVSFNGAVSPFILVSSNTALIATVPAGVSTGPIKVTTPAGSATLGLFYGAPVITGFSPAKGLPGTNVTINGTNFLGASAVRFNGLAATISSVNNSQIVAVAPAGVQTGPISVEAPAGTAVTLTNFVADYTSNLEIWMSASSTNVLQGSNLSYSITMVNRGPFDAPNARWTNTFPSSFTIDSATSGPPWSLTVENHKVVATCASANNGATTTMRVSGRPQAAGTLVATSFITSDYSDPLPANNSATLSTLVDPAALLAIRWWTNQVRVSWPAALSGYLLEVNSDAARTNGWTVLTNVPEISGIQKFITESNAAPVRFYRLRK